MNPSEQRFEDRLFKRVAATERALQEIKTAQPVGADSVAFVNTAEGPATAFATYVLPGSTWWRSIQFTGTIDAGFTSEFGIRFYIDVDNDDDYRLPRGPLLTLGHLQCQASITHDPHEAVAGEKWYHIAMTNGDTVAHTFYGHFTLILPKGAVA